MFDLEKPFYNSVMIQPFTPLKIKTSLVPFSDFVHFMVNENLSLCLP